MATVRVNGVLLHYDEYGSGRPILGIHGTGSSGLLWAGAVPELSARGRLILYDRRGCTRSERPDPYERTSVTEHADDAYALLVALEAVPAILIGRSYGGELAVDLARRHPEAVSALVLLEPAMPTLSPQMREWWRELSARMNAAAADAGSSAAAELLYVAVFGDAGWHELPADLRGLFLDNSPAIMAEVNGGWTTPDATALAGLTLPTLLVSGADSLPAFRAADDALAALLPHVRREVVGGGHLVDPRGPVVLTFLDELPVH